MKFKHLTGIRLKDMKTKIINHKRHYITPHGDYPSVTSVVGIIDKEGLDAWREKVGEGYADAVQFRAMGLGTKLHKLVEEYLNNRDLLPFKEIIPLAHFNNIKRHIDNIDNISKLEAVLYSDTLKLAGRVDCVAEFNGVPSIIDFKTSTKQKKTDWVEKYFLQETAYAIMWNERTGQDIQQIVTIISSEDGTNDVFVREVKDHIDRLHEVIEQYNDSIKDL